MPNMLNAAQTAEFNEKGFTYARGLFAPDEVKLLTDAMEQDPAVRSSILDRLDGEGRATRIALWNRAGNSVYGLAARSQRMVDTSAALLGGPVYHYQSKLTAKEPEVGGAWEWHQDYGYWYYNGCLRPDLLSVMVALDRTTRENGCLQIATGSHKLGRIDHTPLSPTQNEVDPKRMPHILEHCPVEYCELEAGDALIFHCNAIHRSDANRSANRRWTLLICYNRVDNDTIIKTRRSVLRAAGSRRRRRHPPRRPALRPRRQCRALHVAAVRAGPAQGVLGLRDSIHHVVLSEAKDLIAACQGYEILRFAQDDKRSSAVLNRARVCSAWVRRSRCSSTTSSGARDTKAALPSLASILAISSSSFLISFCSRAASALRSMTSPTGRA